MKTWGIVGSVSLLALVGCKENTTPASVAPQAASPKHEPAITPADWNKAFRSAFTLSKEENQDEDGISKSGAKFVTPEGNVISLMKRDAFRKLFFFTPPTFLSINASTNVHSYISIKDNDAPNLLISTYFHNKHGWLFIEKLSIMADGDVILEQDFPHSGVKRDNSSIGVEESYDFVVAPQQLTALRKVSSTTDLKIRITGGKGYYTLPKDRVKEFKEDIRQSILIFDAIDKAVAGKIPTTETKS